MIKNKTCREEVTELTNQIRVAQQRESDLEHAVNLLLKDVVDWFHSVEEGSEKTYYFGVGIAFNVAVVDPLRVICGQRTEDRTIVFWKTEFHVPGREGAHKYVSVYNAEKFRTLPARLRACGVDLGPPTADIVDGAVKALGGAVISYRKARGRATDQAADRAILFSC